MEISRLDAEAEPTIQEPVDLDALVRAVVAARDSDGAVTVVGGRTIVESDRRRLERILANLIGNALEHGGGSAAVHVAADSYSVSVAVADRGPGIPPEQVPRVFDRFHKLDPSRTGPGSGLGLAIAMENARLLGGDIEVDSEPGRGSVFTLRLPVAGSLPPGEDHVAPLPEDETQKIPEGRERT